MRIKAISLILVIALIASVALVGCAEKEPKTSATPTPIPEATATAEPEETATPEPTAEPTPTNSPEPVATVEPGKGTHSGGIVEDKAKVFHFDEENKDLLTAVAVTESAAIQFFATTSFNKFRIRFCTWSKENGDPMTITLYRWMGTYDASLASDPVYTKLLDVYKDNTWVTFDLEKTLEDGEYIIEVFNEGGTPNTGFWGSKEEGGVKQRLYKEGEPQDEVVAQFAVEYTKTPKTLYGPLMDSGF